MGDAYILTSRRVSIIGTAYWMALLALYAFAFLFGICIGSFLNVVIYRVPNGLSIAKGRSFCPQCRGSVRGIDLVPVLGFLLLRGRCRHCGARISPRYPLVELLTGALAVLACWWYGFTWAAMVAFTVLAILLAVAFIDADTMTIPNGLVLALLIPAVCAPFAFPETGWLSRGIGVVAVSLPLLLLSLVIPGSFGGGDIKLTAVCGFLLGWENMLLAAFLAILPAGAYAIFLLATKRRERRAHMAFGPFLAGGIAVAFLWGNSMISAYLSLFHLV